MLISGFCQQLYHTVAILTDDPKHGLQVNTIRRGQPKVSGICQLYTDADGSQLGQAIRSGPVLEAHNSTSPKGPDPAGAEGRRFAGRDGSSNRLRAEKGPAIPSRSSLPSRSLSGAVESLVLTGRSTDSYRPGPSPDRPGAMAPGGLESVIWDGRDGWDCSMRTFLIRMRRSRFPPGLRPK